MRDKILRIVNQKWFLPSASAVGGAIVGYTLGYSRTKRQYDRIEAQIQEMEKSTDQIEFDFEAAGALATEMRESAETIRQYADQIAKSREATISRHPSVGVDYTDALEPSEHLEEKRSGVKSNVTELRKQGLITNIFDNGGGDEWDYKTEIEARDKAAPYVIHVDEYMADEMGWDSQSTLTWYEGDEILCDSHDKPIYNHNEVVGELRFGHGSNDPNVVYIRNERLQAEYEVIRDSGSYEENVLSEQMESQRESEELRHSAVLRFRDD